MKKKYGLKFFGMATLMVFAICLAGCTVNAEDPEEKLVATVTAVADTAVLETTQIDSVAAPAPQHFVETVNEDFHIDATVEEYPADGLAGVYIGEKKDSQRKKLIAFLISVEQQLTPVMNQVLVTWTTIMEFVKMDLFFSQSRVHTTTLIQNLFIEMIKNPKSTVIIPFIMMSKNI